LKPAKKTNTPNLRGRLDHLGREFKYLRRGGRWSLVVRGFLAIAEGHWPRTTNDSSPAC
jgi:hypothetical protein